LPKNPLCELITVKGKGQALKPQGCCEGKKHCDWNLEFLEMLGKKPSYYLI